MEDSVYLPPGGVWALQVWGLAADMNPLISRPPQAEVQKRHNPVSSRLLYRLPSSRCGFTPSLRPGAIFVLPLLHSSHICLRTFTLRKKKKIYDNQHCGTGENTHTQISGNGLTQLLTEFFFQLFKNWGVLNWFIGKDPDARKDWRQEEKGTTEDELVGWHHQLNRHESEQAPEAGDGQGSQACSSPWGRKESDTVRLNWTEKVRYSWFTILVLGVQHSDLKIFIGYIPFIVIKCWLFPWVNWFFKQFIFYFWLCWAFVATWAFL